ncbi:transcription termination factor Rho [Mycobacterium sp. PSTR-4-N]|uniref:transcription termination factor Rho n=1 Tax=Mycobacterium sp. PSTR-4-N TaxID=2917745 RepID=UPI001F1525B6|nr:transcription termination factor Rho [Mycobacterium sp. PSTR-4-N]MCG7597420.1 transcription termination factor Rho [Mycobacterium sp. PSTR-4-N]
MTDTDLITADSSADNGASPAVTTDAPAASAAPARRGALTSMVLPELRTLAKEIGVEGASGMRKSELIAAIRERRGDTNGKSAESAPAAEAPAAEASAPADAAPPQRRERRSASRGQGEAKTTDQPESQDAPRAEAAPAPTEAPERKPEQERGQDSQDTTRDAAEKSDRDGRTQNDGRNQNEGGTRQNEGRNQNESGNRQNDGGRQNDNRNQNDRSQNDRNQNDGGNRQQNQQNDRNQGNRNQDNRNSDNDNDDDGDGRQGRRGRRFRDRRRRERGGEGGGGGADRDTELREDDVVQPVAGILDVLDNYAFVRTSGYLAGPNDVYVSMNMVRKNGLRRGDAVTGAVRVPKEGDGGGQNSRQKFNPLVRLDSVNGKPVEEARKRPEFTKLTPLYPNQRLRLETSGDKLTTRVIDLIMPIGKGQRALIVSPPKAGKTTIMQDIANAITRNNPECHLMVVLVDERPEEVTDMQRSVKGEVIASTFDRPPSDHTQAAELAIERAKRLVEQGKDVVVLLDSITRLGRAYNNASPASGRILSGGVDSTALYPPKRFLGAARNIEEGGSLTIIATAMVETGSTGDTVIFEEFKGTGNAELKLDRKIAERRVFPAVDVNPSGTRKDELLLSPDEFAIVHKLRRVLSGLDPHQAIDLLMSQLRKTKNNYEFLVQVSKNTPGGNGDD